MADHAMITFDDQATFLEIITRSHVVIANATLYDGVTELPDTVNIVGGSITVDRSQQARRALTIEIGLEFSEDYTIPINTLHSRMQIWVGVLDGMTPIWVPAGMFRIDSVTRTNRGSLAVTGTSLEAYVIEDVYADPMTYPIYTRFLDAIQDVIKTSLASATFGPFSPEVLDTDAPIPAPVTVSENRWEMIETLASAINVEVYADPQGVFQVIYKPTLQDNSVATVKEGDDGVLVQAQIGVTRDDTYNGVLALGQSADPNIPPVSSLVTDDDPNSPTFWGGPFGRKTYKYQNELLTTKEMCTNKARILLNELRLQARTVSFNAIPNPLLEPGDVVIIDMLDGTTETHMIGSITIPIGLGDWSATTLTAKDIPVIMPSPTLARNYDVFQRYEPDQDTVITPDTYQGVLADYPNYGKVLVP